MFCDEINRFRMFYNNEFLDLSIFMVKVALRDFHHENAQV